MDKKTIKEILDDLIAKTPEEFELKVIKKPKKPNPYPIITKIENKHRDWKWFLINHV